MKIYDSLSSKFNKLNDKVNIYSCGPTVYNYIHIGNARPILLMDTLIRFLKSQNIKINYIQNITDIDDKIINRAIKENKSEKQISDLFTKEYIKDLNALNVIIPNKIISVRKSMKSIIFYIQKLVEKKAAYIVNGNVYFDIKKYRKEYGKLSKRNINDLIIGERVKVDSNKKDPLDFTLWKNTNLGVKWNSSFGKGRPGWHTECAVIINDYFGGQTIDIHGGGIDLKFPHHENERIQFFASNNKEITKTWMHNGHLNIDNEKMSKTIGNYIFVKDFLKKYNANILRYIFLTTNYKQPLNINEDLINQANKFFEKINNLSKKIILYLSKNELELKKLNSKNISLFNENMNDDLNTSMVLSIIESIIKEINININSQNIFELNYILEVLGFNNLIRMNLTNKEKILINDWEKLLAKKDFKKADKLRIKLKKRGLL